jgi:phosphopantothenoylcysteine synthetase/decarboxylase
MLAGKTIVIGITGGVAAHYLPELIGQLRYRHLAAGLCTDDASGSTLCFSADIAAAAGTPVRTEIFKDAEKDPLAHIRLARAGRPGIGRPGYLRFHRQSSCRNCGRPGHFTGGSRHRTGITGPSMHDSMWANPILQRNLEILKGVGYHLAPRKPACKPVEISGKGVWPVSPPSFQPYRLYPKKQPKQEQLKDAFLRFSMRPV